MPSLMVDRRPEGRAASKVQRFCWRMGSMSQNITTPVGQFEGPVWDSRRLMGTSSQNVARTSPCCPKS
jgi:hypothetical protein